MPTIMITLGAPVYRWNGRLYHDSQSVSGFAAWRDHFGKLIAFTIGLDAEPTADCIDITDEIPGVEVHLLPYGYHLPTFFKHRKAVQSQFLQAMRRADYISFAIGGWIGDWGVVGANVAEKYNIPHAVWFDRVDSQVATKSQDGSVKDQIKARIRSIVTGYNEKSVIRGADLALLHGKTVFDILGRYSANPQLVEDIHLEESDRIPNDMLQTKLVDARNGPLKLCYAGRAHKMKGGADWIATLGLLSKADVSFHADWAGDGEELAAMHQQADDLGISESITFHGFVADRDSVLDLLRKAHILLFCHLTDESPRILIETLHAATPLIGYDDAFAASLVEEKGAGILTQRGDTRALADILIHLAQDRPILCDLITKASQSAMHLTRTKVFEHRSNIIKQHLNPQSEVT